MSVIIPVRDDHHGLRLCLRSLANQTYPAARMEVLVVDNGSRESPADIVSAFGAARLLTEPRAGSYAARNRGLESARGTLIAFTDADCVPAPDWIERGVEHFTATPDCGLLAGRIEVTMPARPSMAHRYEAVAAFDQQRYALRQHFAATANAWIRRSVLAVVPQFDDALLSSGDVDFGRRVHAAGVRACYGDSVVVRHPARDLAALLKKQRRVAGGIRRRGTSGLGSRRRQLIAIVSMAIPFWSALRIAKQLHGAGLWARIRMFLFVVYLRFYRLRYFLFTRTER